MFSIFLENLKNNWIIVTTILIFTVYLYRKLKISYLPNIPIIHDDSLLGYLGMIGKGNGHFKMLRFTEILGGVVQFRSFGRLTVVVNDKTLAKKVLVNLTHKDGFGPEKKSGNNLMQIRNIFTSDTNDYWRLRRLKFRHSFSSLSLKKYDSMIENIVKEFIGILSLDSNKSKNNVLQLDKYFSMLTIDIICNFSFHKNINAIHNSETFNELHDSLRDLFQSAWMPQVMPFFSYTRVLPFPPFKAFFDNNDKIFKFCLSLFNHIKSLESSNKLDSDSFAFQLIEFSRLENITTEQVLSEIAVIFIAG